MANDDIDPTVSGQLIQYAAASRIARRPLYLEKRAVSLNQLTATTRRATGSSLRCCPVKAKKVKQNVANAL